MLRMEARKAMMMRTTLVPPAVEPEQPPMNIKMMSSIFAGGNQLSKSADA